MIFVQSHDRDQKASRPIYNLRAAILESICSLTECNFEKGELTEEEIEVAQSLYQNQYSKDEWNLGILVEE